MREERGRLAGNVTITESIELWGSIGGNCTVVDGGKLYVRGAIYGNLVVEDGGRVHLFGNIAGSITVHDGAKVIISGVVAKDVINTGGRIVIDKQGKVMGRIKTKSGETKVEGQYRDA